MIIGGQVPVRVDNRFLDEHYISSHVATAPLVVLPPLYR